MQFVWSSGRTDTFFDKYRTRQLFWLYRARPSKRACAAFIEKLQAAIDPSLAAGGTKWTAPGADGKAPVETPVSDEPEREREPRDPSAPDHPQTDQETDREGPGPLVEADTPADSTGGHDARPPEGEQDLPQTDEAAPDESEGCSEHVRQEGR